MSASAWGAFIFLIGGGAVALIGVVLLIWALLSDRSRGRRRCSKCWYDLSKTEGLRCSECGHEVQRERQLFKTRRRWRWAALALLLILSGIGGIGWQRTRNFDWNTIKPVWWLLREADGKSPAGGTARNELLRRVNANQLSDSQVDAIVAAALQVQADPSVAWSGSAGDEWCQMVEKAWDNGRLSNEQIERYCRQAFESSFFIEARARIREGKPLPLRIGIRTPRVSSRWHIFSPSQPLLTLFAERKLPPTRMERWFDRILNLGSSAVANSWSMPEWDLALPIGIHDVPLDFDFAVFRHQRNQQVDSTKELADIPNALVRWKWLDSLRVEVVPVTESCVRMVADEMLFQHIVEAIEPEFIHDRVIRGRASYHGTEGIILVHPVPVDLSFDVFARVDGVEEKIGAIAVQANQPGIHNAQSIERHPRTIFPDAARFDLVLRASPDAAEKTIDIFEAWDGEIVIKDVPLREASP
jgi:hypothetical protein